MSHCWARRNVLHLYVHCIPSLQTSLLGADLKYWAAEVMQEADFIIIVVRTHP